MFNKFRLGAAGVALIAAVGMASSANAAVSANASAQAEILAALTLAPATGSTLNFGTIAVNGADTVTIDAAGGTFTCGSGTNLVCSGTAAPVTFDVTGGANQTVGVTLPTAAITVSNGSGGTMSVDGWNASSTTVALGTGSASFDVGAVLHVGASQAAGTYSGTFSVSVAYQ